MLSRGHEYHLAPGSLLSLHCEFYMEAFDAFDNPVIWVKSQSTPANGGARRININVMRIIQSPFSADEDRFVVTFIKQPPRYELLLTVKGKTLFCMLCISPSSRVMYRLCTDLAPRLSVTRNLLYVNSIYTAE